MDDALSRILRVAAEGKIGQSRSVGWIHDVEVV